MVQSFAQGQRCIRNFSITLAEAAFRIISLNAAALIENLVAYRVLVALQFLKALRVLKGVVASD